MADEAKKILLGLDLGTNSVGWCVTDENDNIIKKSGKALWGSRLFDGASDASGRRANRTARRRLDRRKRRMFLLQEIFRDEVNKVDPHFFDRLEESTYHIEDKNKSGHKKQTLFVDDGFNDKQFYERFPTIYHLRDYLYKSHEREDIRFIYLAMAHMIKYRGNFLYEGQEFKASDIKQLRGYFEELNNILNSLSSDGDQEFEEIKLGDDFEEEFNKKLLTIHGITKKKEALKDIFQTKNSYINEVIAPLIAGSSTPVKKIFHLEEDNDEIKSISFSDAAYEENHEKIESLFAGSQECQILDICKRLYDYVILGNMIGDCENISEAMIKRYEKHANDLKELKKYIKDQDKLIADKDKKLSPQVFRIKKDKTANYVSYVGFTIINGKKISSKHCSKKDFYKFLKEKLGIGNVKKVEEIENPYLRKIFSEMEDEDFLPRINSTDNGVLPYQLNQLEMEKILETQSEFYPFLKNEDDGITNIEKIEKLLTFRVPYYIGPSKGEHSWAVFVDNGKKQTIYPWNFFDVIDKHKSAEAFIKRMLNKCTYLPNCDCLPLNSLMYQEYMVYSYLNKIQINGADITPSQKEDIIEKLFKARKTVSKKNIQNYFGTKAKIMTINNKEIDDAVPSLSNYVFFGDVFGREFVDNNKELIENIITDLTVFEDNDIVEDRLSKKYGINDKKIINKIKNKRMSGWGRISKELLELKTPVVLDTGEVIFKSILTMMKETNANLMQLINDDKYTFEKQIDDANKQTRKEFSSPKERHDQIVEYVDNCYVSPGMKRPLIQAMSIIEDVQKILNRPIDEYYIECTRTNKEKKGEKTKSRKEYLDTFYKKALDLTKDDIKAKIKNADIERKEIFDLKSQLEDCASKLRSDKYFLYFLQLGKCVYTGNPINLADLQNNNIYDIDHIIPQALIKDDSLDNRVLVEASKNRDKSCDYPIPQGHIEPKGRALIERLYKIGYMSNKKYSNLLRTRELDKGELTTFVNRQLVYTNQAVKALTELIEKFETKNNGKTPKIVYSKAENVSDFRHDYEIIKSRDANHFHHAHDAYLNICVGRAVNKYFSQYKDIDLQELKGKKISLNARNVFKKAIKIEDKWIPQPNLFDYDGSVIWNHGTSIKKIKENIFDRHDIMCTTMQYIKHGQLTDATIYPANDKGLIPLKSKNGNPLSKAEKYGGKKGVTYGFYSYAEYKVGKVRKRTLFSIPLLYSNGSDPNKTLSYLHNQYPKYQDIELLISVVRINAILKKGKSKACISGVNGIDTVYYIQNVSEIYYDQSSLITIKKISKLIDLFGKNKLSFEPKKLEDYEKPSSFFDNITDEAIIISPAANERTKAVILTSGELDDLLKVLFKKIDSNIMVLFSGLRNVKDSILEKNGVYSALPIWQKAYIINQIVLLLSGQTSSADLSILYKEFNESTQEYSYKVGGNAGRSGISASLDGIDAIMVESPTGFYTKNLLKGK